MTQTPSTPPAAEAPTATPGQAPDLELVLGDGRRTALGDFRGGWLVLYFYPKDSTPGCTRQGIAFSELLPEFERAGAKVLGVSRDSQKSHQNFTARQGLKFDLVSDPDETVCRAFGVIQEKTLYGRKYMGIVRSTFLIDPEGRVREVWQPVKVPGHAEAVLDALRRHQKAA